MPNCNWCFQKATLVRSVFAPNPFQEFSCNEHFEEHMGDKNNSSDWELISDGREPPVYNINWADWAKEYYATCDDFLHLEARGKTKKLALNNLLAAIERGLTAGNRSLTRYTSGFAKNEMKRWFLPKERAKQLLSQVKDIVDELQECRDDTRRAFLYRNFVRLTEGSYTEGTSKLLMWSQIANDPDYK